MTGYNFYVDTVWIQDDLSGEETTKHYTDDNFINAMAPIKIKLRVTTKKFKPGRATLAYPIPSYLFNLVLKDFRRYIQALLTFNLAPEEDIRYQWAINNTTASKLFIMHDDILFRKNIIKKYLDEFNKNPNLAIIGDLGQCWACAHQNNCSPSKIMKQEYPSGIWPRTYRTKKKKNLFDRNYERECRINEWCCLIDVEKIRKIKSHFGNYIDGGDIAAFWFEDMIKSGYSFSDPLPKQEQREEYYIHGFEGHSGHSVWIDQGSGIQKYNKELINKKLLEEFNYKLNY